MARDDVDVVLHRLAQLIALLSNRARKDGSTVLGL